MEPSCAELAARHRTDHDLEQLEAANEAMAAEGDLASFLQANIDWLYLGEDVQDALKAVDVVRDAYVARKQECKGAYSGDVSKECERKDLALKKAIVKAVQNGDAKIPVPERRP